MTSSRQQETEFDQVIQGEWVAESAVPARDFSSIQTMALQERMSAHFKFTVCHFLFHRPLSNSRQNTSCCSCFTIRAFKLMKYTGAFNVTLEAPVTSRIRIFVFRCESWINQIVWGRQRNILSQEFKTEANRRLHNQPFNDCACKRTLRGDGSCVLLFLNVFVQFFFTPV